MLRRKVRRSLQQILADLLRTTPETSGLSSGVFNPDRQAFVQLGFLWASNNTFAEAENVVTRCILGCHGSKLGVMVLRAKHKLLTLPRHTLHTAMQLVAWKRLPSWS